MPRRRERLSNDVQQDFYDALERLKSARPQHPDLRERLRRGKPLKINYATVAQEAGRARGLISKENCRYPDVRQRVLLETVEVTSTRDDVITNLRAQVAELRVQLRQAEAHAAYHFSEKVKAQKDAVFKQKYERLKLSVEAERGKRQNRSTKVVPLFADDDETPRI